MANRLRQLQKIKRLRRGWVDAVGEGQSAGAVKLIGRKPCPLAQGQSNVRRDQNVTRTVRRASVGVEDKCAVARDVNIGNPWWRRSGDVGISRRASTVAGANTIMIAAA